MPDTALAAETKGVTLNAQLRYNVFTGVKPVNETFGPNNMTRRISGQTEDKAVVLHDGRALRDTFDIEVSGFEFVDHVSKMQNWFDEKELAAVYYPECVELIKKVSGAARVHVFDHTLRRRAPDAARQPSTRVHVDYTAGSAPRRVAALLGEDQLEKHFAFINVWRPVRWPATDWPLALADVRAGLDA